MSDPISATDLRPMAMTTDLGQGERPLFGITPAEYAARRRKVLCAVADRDPAIDIVLLKSPAAPVGMERARYRSDDAILYLTGIDTPNACLALFPNGDNYHNQVVLFLPLHMHTMGGDSPVSASETEALTGIPCVRDISEIYNALTPMLKPNTKLLVNGLNDDHAPMKIWVKDYLNIPPEGSDGSAEQLVFPMRKFKSAAEIANLRAAVETTTRAHANAIWAIRPGITEMDVEGVVLAAYRAGGCVRAGFPSMIGSGPNACLPHHIAGDRRMVQGDLVVVDIGAEFNYYSADITRTYPVSGMFTPRQRELYDLVLSAQEACVAKFKQHMTLGDLTVIAVETLRSSPLRATDVDGMEHTMDHFFWPQMSVSHFIGLDVHDIDGPVADLINDDTLTPGVVFTIEPGIYIKTENIGIRIEDDYLVNTDGRLEKLSRHIPVQAAEIEAIMRTRAALTSIFL